MKFVDEGIWAQVCHEIRILFFQVISKSLFQSFLIGIEVAGEQTFYHTTEYGL
jgi:hypothetical protein